MRKIVFNRIRTPDGTLLTSTHRHDFVAYLDANGCKYVVDGGLDYLRRSYPSDFPPDELSIYSDASFDVIRESVAWNIESASDHSPHWVAIEQLDTKYIRQILDSPRWIAQRMRKILEQELAFRSQLCDSMEK